MKSNLLYFRNYVQGAAMSMRRLSVTSRLFIVFSSFAVIESLVIFTTIHGIKRGVALYLVLTGVLAAWLFPWRAAIALEFALLLIYMAISIALDKSWMEQMMLVFAGGVFMDLFVVACIGCLRSALDKGEAANRKERELNAMKDRFIAHVNHKLRNPLMEIQCSLDVIASGEASTEECNYFLGCAIQGCRELERMTGNLGAMRDDYDISSPCMRVFNLESTLYDILRNVNTRDHPLNIDISDDIVVRGDSQQVRQVMLNLLSNAFKYTPCNALVTVRAWKDAEDACVCVQDQGLGISRSQIPYLFQKFSQFEQNIATKRMQGVGLGLYVCRRFIENMGGRIWVDSTEGQGSRFYFFMPLVVRRDALLTKAVIIEREDINV